MGQYHLLDLLASHHVWLWRHLPLHLARLPAEDGQDVNPALLVGNERRVDWLVRSTGSESRG